MQRTTSTRLISPTTQAGGGPRSVNPKTRFCVHACMACDRSRCWHHGEYCTAVLVSISSALSPHVCGSAVQSLDLLLLQQSRAIYSCTGMRTCMYFRSACYTQTHFFSVAECLKNDFVCLRFVALCFAFDRVWRFYRRVRNSSPRRKRVSR